jgi:hypothetical protein
MILPNHIAQRNYQSGIAALSTKAAMAMPTALLVFPSLGVIVA